MLERLKRLTVIGATCLLAAMAAAPASHAASASASGPRSGINVGGVGYLSEPGEANRTVALARGLHVKIIRADFPWSVLEPERGVISSKALAEADSLVNAAAAAGIQVSATVDDTPCWASSAPTTLLRQCTPGQRSTANSWPPGDPAGYAAFVAFLAQRYGSKLAAIEIWNEPDQANEAYFAGPNKAVLYAGILRAAYTAIKQVAPQVPVLGGSLVGSNGVFLKHLYAAGIKGYYDGLSVHFYTLTLAALRATHEVQLAAGDKTPLWLDEFGWSSCWPQRRVEQDQGCVTPSVQAENLRSIFRALAGAPYVASAVVYKLQDSPSEEFGVISQRGTHKQSFGALAGVGNGVFGRSVPVSLSLRRSGRSLIASGSAPVGDFIRLEAFSGGALRYRALFTLDRFNRFKLTLPAALGTSGLKVRVAQLWGGAAAQRSV
jgi:hypothetical protein